MFLFIFEVFLDFMRFEMQVCMFMWTFTRPASSDPGCLPYLYCWIEKQTLQLSIIIVTLAEAVESVWFAVWFHRLCFRHILKPSRMAFKWWCTVGADRDLSLHLCPLILLCIAAEGMFYICMLFGKGWSVLIHKKNCIIKTCFVILDVISV